ncbi:MAG: thioredoxin family protein [Odoribacter sp.]
MKKIFLLAFLIAGIIFGLEAQNRSIDFQHIEWKKALKLAKKEKKLIFVDCYTSWCGPCKMLAKDVFTQDAVGDFFNQHFVNLKLDMEKDADGVALKVPFGIKAFPTLVFVDPTTQQVVHRMVGAGSAEWLLAGAKDANDPQNNLSGLTKRYEAGERGVAFLGNYLNALASAYMAKEQSIVASEYLNSLTDEQIATKENWDLIVKNVNDPLSKPLKQVMANREKFYEIAGKEVVEHTLAGSMYMAVMELSSWRPGMAEAFNENRNTELVNYLLSVDYDQAPAALANLYTAALVRKGDFRGMLDKMQEVFSYNLFREGAEKAYFQNYIETLTSCDDKALVEEGIRWIDKMCQATDDYFEKADLMNSKARLQKKNGDTLGMDKSKMEEEKYAKEAEKRSGGRMMRAARMN